MLKTRKKISEDQTRRIEKLKKEAKKQIKAKGRKDLKAILEDIFHRSRGLQHCADSKQFSQKLRAISEKHKHVLRKHPGQLDKIISDLQEILGFDFHEYSTLMLDESSEKSYIERDDKINSLEEKLEDHLEDVPKETLSFSDKATIHEMIFQHRKGLRSCKSIEEFDQRTQNFASETSSNIQAFLQLKHEVDYFKSLFLELKKYLDLEEVASEESTVGKTNTQDEQEEEVKNLKISAQVYLIKNNHPRKDVRSIMKELFDDTVGLINMSKEGFISAARLLPKEQDRQIWESEEEFFIGLIQNMKTIRGINNGDPDSDQSLFASSITSQEMSRLRFPGKKTKAVQDPSKNKDFSSDDSNWTNLKLNQNDDKKPTAMHGNDSDFSYFPPSSASPTNNISQKQSQSQNTFDNTVNFSLLDNQQAHVPQKMSNANLRKPLKNTNPRQASNIINKNSDKETGQFVNLGFAKHSNSPSPSSQDFIKTPTVSPTNNSDASNSIENVNLYDSIMEHVSILENKPCSFMEKEPCLYRCKLCEFTFLNLSETEKHIYEIHSGELQLSPIAKSMSSKEMHHFTKVDGQDQYKCCYCDNYFSPKTEILNHVQFTHDIEIESSAPTDAKPALETTQIGTDKDNNIVLENDNENLIQNSEKRLSYQAIDDVEKEILEFSEKYDVISNFVLALESGLDLIQKDLRKLESDCKAVIEGLTRCQEKLDFKCEEKILDSAKKKRKSMVDLGESLIQQTEKLMESIAAKKFTSTTNEENIQQCLDKITMLSQTQCTCQKCNCENPEGVDKDTNLCLTCYFSVQPKCTCNPALRHSVKMKKLFAFCDKQKHRLNKFQQMKLQKKYVSTMGEPCESAQEILKNYSTYINHIAVSNPESGDCLYQSISIILVGDLSLVPLLRLLTSMILVLQYEDIDKELRLRREAIIGKDKSNLKKPENETLSAILNNSAKMQGWAGKYEFSALSRILGASINILYPSPYGKNDLNIKMNGGKFGKASDPSRTIELIFYNSTFQSFVNPSTKENLYRAVHFAPLLVKQPPVFQKSNEKSFEAEQTENQPTKQQDSMNNDSFEMADDVSETKKVPINIQFSRPFMENHYKNKYWEPYLKKLKKIVKKLNDCKVCKSKGSALNRCKDCGKSLEKLDKKCLEVRALLPDLENWPMLKYFARQMKQCKKATQIIKDILSDAKVGVKVTGDGSCFYYALSYLICGSGELANALRLLTFTSLLQNWREIQDEYLQKVHELVDLGKISEEIAVEEFLYDILQNCASIKGYAGSCEISAAAKILNVRINIVMEQVDWQDGNLALTEGVYHGLNSRDEISMLFYSESNASPDHFSPILNDYSHEANENSTMNQKRVHSTTSNNSDSSNDSHGNGHNLQKPQRKQHKTSDEPDLSWLPKSSFTKANIEKSNNENEKAFKPEVKKKKNRDRNRNKSEEDEVEQLVEEINSPKSSIGKNGPKRFHTTGLVFKRCVEAAKRKKVLDDIPPGIKEYGFHSIVKNFNEGDDDDFEHLTDDRGAWHWSYPKPKPIKNTTNYEVFELVNGRLRMVTNLIYKAESGTFRQKRFEESNGKQKCVIGDLDDDIHTDEFFVLKKYYCYHSESREWRRKFTYYIRTSEEFTFLKNVVYCEYLGKDVVGDTCDVTQKNANKIKKGYTKWDPTHKKECRKAVEEQKTNQEIRMEKEDINDPFRKSLRNDKQLYNMRHNMKKKKGGNLNLADMWFSLESQLRTEGHEFVQHMATSNVRPGSSGQPPNKDAGTVVMYDPFWLRDFLYQTSPDLNPKAQPAFVDLTYDLGGYYVLQFSYYHTQLCTERSGGYPLIQGPSIFIPKRDFLHYATALNALSIAIAEINPDGARLMFCTDREPGLQKGLIHAFGPTAIYFVCTLHLKQNVKDHLRSMGVDQKQYNKIVYRQLFDHDNSLAASKSKEDFNIRMAEIDHHLFEEKYFEEYTKVMWENLVKPRIEFPWISFTLTNNPAESQNHRMKLTAQWKVQDLFGMIKTLHINFKDSTSRVIKSIWDSNGHYQLRKEVSHLHVLPTNWIRLTSPQKTRKITRFINASLPKKDHIVVSKNEMFQTTTPSRAKKPNTSGRPKKTNPAKYGRSKKTNTPFKSKGHDDVYDNDSGEDDEPFDALDSMNPFNLPRKDKAGKKVDKEQRIGQTTDEQKKKWKLTKDKNKTQNGPKTSTPINPKRRNRRNAKSKKDDDNIFWE